MTAGDTVPYDPGPLDAVTAVSESRTSPPSLRAGDDGARILVVEDESLIARDLAELLRSLDYEVPAIVAEGADVLGAVREHRPDLVLMDIRLADDVSGVEAAREVRSEQDVPVVYTSAYADEDTLADAVRSRPYGYVVKPYTGDSLRTAVEVALARHRTERMARERAWWLRQMVAHSRDAVLVVDDDGRLSHASAGVRELLGCRSDDVGHTAVFDRVHPDDEGRAREALARCMESPGEPVKADLRLAHGEGGWRAVETVGRAVRGPCERVRILVSARPAGNASGDEGTVEG